MSEYVKENVLGAVLKEANSHSFVISKLIRKPVKSKPDPRKENDSIFAYLYLVIMRFSEEGIFRNVCHRTCFIPKEPEIGK